MRSLSPARFRPFFLLFIPLLLIPFAVQPTLAQSPPKAATPSTPQQHAVPPPAPTAQDQFLVYWTTEAGWSTELLLRNNLEANPLTVTPALRTPEGTETSLPAVTIQSGDVASLDLYSTLLKAAPQLLGAWGSLVLRYSSTVNGGLYASAMVRADGRPIAFHLDAYARGTKYEVGSREGIWWLPWDSVTDYLILTNSGEQSIQPNLVLYDSSGKAWQQNLSLGKHETRRLSIRPLLQQAGLQGSYGGIKIDMPKDARYLDSAHLLFEESGGFSAVMKMFRHDPSTTLPSRSFGGVTEWTTRAPMLALSNPDPALAFPVGTTLQPKVFIRNTSNKTVTAHLRFNWRSATTNGKTTPLDLFFKANETRLIDVAALQAQKLLPSDANWASVVLSAPVQPDELLAVAASYDQTGRYGAQTPFNDQLASHWEAGKWEVDGTHNSLVTVGNGGNKPELAQLTILYNQGKGQYQIEKMLAPDEQMILDFGKLIHAGVPDNNGQTLPPDLSYGAYRILDLTDHAAGGLYEGKVIVDKRYGHAAYGCGICCGPRNAYMVFNPMVLPVGGSSGQQIDAPNSCTGNIVNITGDFPTWWTDNTAIATANGRQINGIAVGSTNHDAQSISMYFGPRVEAGGEPCPLDQEQPIAGTNVEATVSISGPGYVPLRTGSSTGQNSMTLTATGTPNGGTYGGTYTWSTSSSNVTLSNTSSANVTVTAAAASQNRGDTPITVKYVINGDTNCTNANNCASATLNITVSKPSSLFLVTDIPNSTGHTCDASATTNNCTKSTFTGSGSYTSYVRTRTYHIMDQFNPPSWISGYNMDIQESYSPPSGQCASDAKVVTTPGTGDTAVDCFYFCSATCQSGGSCNVSATQSITVNGYSVGTKSVTWTCSDATIQP